MTGFEQDERLARYVAGEMSAGEAAALEREAAADARFAAQLRTARAAWAGASGPGADVDVDAAWRRLDARRARARAEAGVIPLRPDRQQPAIAPATRVLPRRRFAVAAMLLIAAGALLWQLVQPGAQQFATGTGEQREWTLRDGSTVRLGPASSLEVPRGYGSRHRTVRLAHGEAFFRVAPADAPALTVLVRGALVRDIGTAFTVRALAGEDRLDVTVTEGTVWVGSAATAPEGGVLLQGGERGRVGLADGLVTALGAADTAVALAWTQGRLVLRDAPLEEVARQLKRWYGLDVHFDSRLAALRLNAEFAGEPAETVLDVIAQSLGLTWEQTGATVSFERNRTP